MVTILSAFRELGRLRDINLVLLRHGFGELAMRIGLGKSSTTQSGDSSAIEEELKKGEQEKAKHTLATRIRLVAMDLGPSFVKLGQIASTRADILPKEWVLELKKLQDEVNPLPFEDIRGAVEKSLGVELESVFDEFSEEPLAAASIGQVHRAVLKHEDGPKDVVVKVQRPGVRATVARDLELLYDLAKLIERTIPESKIYNPSGLVEQFDTAITAELDFLLEAENARRFQQNFQGHDEVRFPTVYREASTRSVLTLEFLPGGKVYEAIEKHGFKGPVIAKTSVGVVIKMIFEDGFFHADPHPGNILVSGTPDAPVMGLVDLGMVGRLSPEMRDRTIDLMVAAGRQDYAAIADALWAIGTPTKKVDMRAYRAEVAVLSEKYLGRPLKEIELSGMIGDLVNGGKKYGLEIPADFMLVGKALMTIEGVGKEIDPDLDVFQEVRPYFLDLLRKRYSPERLTNDLWRGLSHLSTAAYDMPQQMREVLDDLRLGRLTVNTSDPSLAKIADRLGRRLFAGLVVLAFVIAGTWLVAKSVHLWLGGILLAFGVVTMLGHVATDFLRRWR